MIFTVEVKDVVKQLERKGFEVIGEVGDDINKKKVYTIRGDEGKISKREMPAIIKMKFKQGKGELFRQRKFPTFS